jgi:hypothetical protein
MDNLLELHLKPETLQRHGLPDIAYPVPVAELTSALDSNGELPFAVMLHGLQQRAGVGGEDWKCLEPAMDRLAELLTTEDGAATVAAGGDDWWLEIGPVDLEAELVTIQRNDDLIAAITPRNDGRLRVAVFRPLDCGSAAKLIGLSGTPHPEHGVCMRENNWQYALDCSFANGNIYACEEGRAFLCYWENNGDDDQKSTGRPGWRRRGSIAARPVSRVALELGVHYTLSGDKEPRIS